MGVGVDDAWHQRQALSINGMGGLDLKLVVQGHNATLMHGKVLDPRFAQGTIKHQSLANQQIDWVGKLHGNHHI